MKLSSKEKKELVRAFYGDVRPKHIRFSNYDYQRMANTTTGAVVLMKSRASQLGISIVDAFKGIRK